MYIGALFLVAGFALLWQSTTLLLAVQVVFAGAHLLVTLHEEPGLRKRFGLSYKNYCHDVSRWLPCARL